MSIAMGDLGFGIGSWVVLGTLTLLHEIFVLLQWARRGTGIPPQPQDSYKPVEISFARPANAEITFNKY